MSTKLRLIFLPLLACCAAEPENLLRNPGFEDAVGGEPAGWQKTVDPRVRTCQIGVSTIGAHSGKQAIRIARVWGNNKGMAGIKTAGQIPIDPAANYLLTFWYRTAGIAEYGMPFAVHVNIGRKDHKPLAFKSRNIWRSPEWRQIQLLVDGLPADAVSTEVSFGITIRTRGELFIDDVVLQKAAEKDVRSFEQWRRQQLPVTVRNAATLREKGTGSFRLAQTGGHWWLIQPDGRPTWLMGSMGRYPTQLRERYPDEAGYRAMLYKLIESWGFNSFEGWTDDQFGPLTEQRYRSGEAYLPMFKVLSLSREIDPALCARDRDGNVKGGPHAFPDPFNPEWRQRAARKVQESTPAFRDKPWFVGWFVDNEVDFYDLFRFVWAEHSGKQFISALEKKYGSIEKLNKAWTSKFRSFADILTQKPEPADWDDPLFPDFTEFERAIVREYVNFTYDLVKKADPNHLVISNRINLGPMPDIHRTVDLWGRYDLVAMNIYPQNLLIGLAPGEIEIMEALHKGTGKPLIIGEWGVSAIDSGLYNLDGDAQGRPLDWSWREAVRNQKERGEVYRACLTQLASLKFFIGAHWFQTFDVDTAIRRANRGVLNSSHQPYSDLVSAMQETNASLKKKMALPPIQRRQN